MRCRFCDSAPHPNRPNSKLLNIKAAADDPSRRNAACLAVFNPSSPKVCKRHCVQQGRAAAARAVPGKDGGEDVEMRELPLDAMEVDPDPPGAAGDDLPGAQRGATIGGGGAANAGEGVDSMDVDAQTPGGGAGEDIFSEAPTVWQRRANVGRAAPLPDLPSGTTETEVSVPTTAGSYACHFGGGQIDESG